jgi:hypothetical protein
VNQPAKDTDCDDPSDEYQSSLEIGETVGISTSRSVDGKPGDDSNDI